MFALNGLECKSTSTKEVLLTLDDCINMIDSIYSWTENSLRQAAMIIAAPYRAIEVSKTKRYPSSSIIIKQWKSNDSI